MKYTLITLAALSGSAFAQTVVNGDFSNLEGMTVGTGGGWYKGGVPAGWSSNAGNIEVITPGYGSVPSGFSSNYIDVTGPPNTPLTLSQQVSGLIQGQQYTLSYDWGNRASDPYDMTVSIGEVSTSHTGTGYVAATNNTLAFTASAPTETLSITFNHTNGDTGTGFNTTNFTITPVPEPSSAALLGLGGLALILHRRK